MKRFLKKLRVQNIDVLVYEMTCYEPLNLVNSNYVIKKERLKNKWFYYIKQSKNVIHKSYLFDSVFLLKLINKKGPVIGDCYTQKKFRGQSIYPYVINTIAKEVLENGEDEVFIIVNRKNKPSIRGIEKAGFTRKVSIKTRRWLYFYLKKQITQY